MFSSLRPPTSEFLWCWWWAPILPGKYINLIFSLKGLVSERQHHPLPPRLFSCLQVLGEYQWKEPLPASFPTFSFYFSWLLPLWSFSFFFFPQKNTFLPTNSTACSGSACPSIHTGSHPSIPIWFLYLLNQIADSSNRAQACRPRCRADAELHACCKCRIIWHLQQRVAEPLTLFLWDCWW